MTYPEILQTIGVLCSVVSAGSTVYVTYIAKRLHGSVQGLNETAKDVHQTMKDQQRKDT